jgi:2-oxoglutarate ferredoxin oxidoreductase subunit alpha
MPTRTQQSDVLSCAYASHGDTKHVLLFPEDPRECFEFAATSLDLADRLQTPVFMLTDLDIGMNQRLCKPLAWDDNHQYDRGKVLSREDLEASKDFGRYVDVDGDAIPYRTLPGTHPTKGSYFTRGTSRNTYAIYSEAGPDYTYNMQRLLRKFETAKQLVPKPLERKSSKATRFGVLYYGSTSPAMDEAMDRLEEQGLHVDAMRVRAFPFHESIIDFIAAHDHVFVVEQNRDAQLRTMLMVEGAVEPAKLMPVLHYDGTPITARFIVSEIAQRLSAFNVKPIKKDKAA